MAANLITQMRADDGSVLIPGFGDNVRALTTAEKIAITDLPPVDDALKQQFAIGRTEGNDGLVLSVMRPALNINGLRSGQVGEAATNSIPANAEISIDFRLVPDQTPRAVRAKVEGFLKDKGWTLVADEPDLATRLAHPRIIRLAWERGYPGLRSDMSAPVARAVIAAASRAARYPVAKLPMMGGSVPIYLFADIFHTRHRSSNCQSRQQPTCGQREPSAAESLRRNPNVRRDHDATEVVTPRQVRGRALVAGGIRIQQSGCLARIKLALFR
jgi:acetylornithine deacetylase/succinyl-diaminopimelate desuccinylase-like protein